MRHEWGGPPETGGRFFASAAGAPEREPGRRSPLAARPALAIFRGDMDMMDRRIHAGDGGRVDEGDTGLGVATKTRTRTKSPSPYKVLMPIPQTQMDANPLLTQNPGY